MKKSLFALAALGAFASAAQAQSSVTLYGTLDASVGYLGNMALTAPGSNAGAGITTATTGPQALNATNNMQGVTNAINSGVLNTGNAIGFIDGAISTSLWGMKGTEDLGGGMKANFDLQGDAPTNNGQTHNDGLFRRSAWVGLSGNWGEVKLGRQPNPFPEASATFVPVEGNTVHQARSVTRSSLGDQFSNAVSYTTPTMSGLKAKVLYAMSNTAGEGNNGAILAANAFFNMGSLDIAAAYNQAWATGGTTALPYSTTNTAAEANKLTTNPFNGGNAMGYAAGIKYKLGAFSIGYGFWHGDGDNGTAIVATTATTNLVGSSNGSRGVGQSTYSGNVNLVGIGYQATPTLLLGVNYAISTLDSTFTNVQARYSLSKRTTTYFQASMAKNGAGTTNDGILMGNWSGTSTNSNTTGSANLYGVTPASFTGLPNTTQTAFQVGVIHSF
jgi:general bacterial porin, GBP family